MNDCIFCNIIAGEMRSFKVYEDEHTIAFLDIHPNNIGHTLVISKDHFENIYGIPDEALCRVMIVVKKLAIAIKNGVDADGIHIAMNNESGAGQEVPHAHIHIIPRFHEDGFTHWPQKNYKEGEAEIIVKKISNELNT